MAEDGQSFAALRGRALGFVDKTALVMDLAENE